MKPERHLSEPHKAGSLFLPHNWTGDPEDEVLRELRTIWPSPVDLAKQPGLLYRLHAILND
ncbi:MAG: hypothetical protein ACOY4T_10670 [Pseudomonadota bacterium]